MADIFLKQATQKNKQKLKKNAKMQNDANRTLKTNNIIYNNQNVNLFFYHFFIPPTL